MTFDPETVRQWLLAARQDVLGQIADLDGTFADIVSASRSVATDDEHDPEGATIAFERAQVASLSARTRQHLADIDAALARLTAGAYGQCERCGGAIAVERLEARPAARTCIACAQRPAR